MLTDIQFFKSRSIDDLNEKIWKYIYNSGKPLKFGSAKEPKAAREIFAVIQIYGKALKDTTKVSSPKAGGGKRELTKSTSIC
jgi:hypothetical protein